MNNDIEIIENARYCLSSHAKSPPKGSDSPALLIAQVCLHTTRTTNAFAIARLPGSPLTHQRMDFLKAREQTAGG